MAGVVGEVWVRMSVVDVVLVWCGCCGVDVRSSLAVVVVMVVVKSWV